MYKLTDIYKQIKEEETTQSQYKIYCDMDGVIADFDKRFEQYAHMSSREYEAKYGTQAFWDLISKEGVKFWVGIPWMPNGKELWNILRNTIQHYFQHHQEKMSRVWVKDYGLKITCLEHHLY